MSAPPSKEQERAVTCAAAALAHAWGTAVSLSDVTALSDDKRRNLILRASAVRDGMPPRSVILKATRASDFNPAAANAFEASGLVKEWTATTFLAGDAPDKGHCPAFLAGDATRGLMVFEDLGADLGTLVGPLLEGSATTAESALLAYAACLGRLHADTLDCTERHTAALHRAFPAAQALPPVGGERWRRQVVAKVLALLGGSPPEEEIAAVAQHMAHPGAWLGLAHRDACPDNVLLTGSRARLLDFEFAGPGHVLLDATYWRMGFPTCWCAGRVPDAVAARMDRVYRDALGLALPIARDDQAYATELAFILFGRLFASHAWLLEEALREDTDWGIATRRSRLLWHLDAAIEGAAQSDTLPGLRAAATHWRAALAERWPGTQPLALYPAFRR